MATFGCRACPIICILITDDLDLRMPEQCPWIGGKADWYLEEEENEE
ncbi:MAG TPA: hypothetical protein PLN56_11330 [Methanoregulaceae archaeon]|nr:hypothetical protein [Methanoregulaceae archaeon]